MGKNQKKNLGAAVAGTLAAGVLALTPTGVFATTPTARELWNSLYSSDNSKIIPGVSFTKINRKDPEAPVVYYSVDTEALGIDSLGEGWTPMFYSGQSVSGAPRTEAIGESAKPLVGMDGTHWFYYAIVSVPDNNSQRHVTHVKSAIWFSECGADICYATKNAMAPSYYQWVGEDPEATTNKIREGITLKSYNPTTKEFTYELADGITATENGLTVTELEDGSLKYVLEYLADGETLADEIMGKIDLSECDALCELEEDEENEGYYKVKNAESTENTENTEESTPGGPSGGSYGSSSQTGVGSQSGINSTPEVVAKPTEVKQPVNDKPLESISTLRPGVLNTVSFAYEDEPTEDELIEDEEVAQEESAQDEEVAVPLTKSPKSEEDAIWVKIIRFWWILPIIILLAVTANWVRKIYLERKK